MAFGLLFSTFLSTLGVPGQSRGAFGHPWAPKAQKVRKRSQKAAKGESLFEHFLVVFAQKRVFLMCFFLDSFFNRFLVAPGPPRTCKNKQNHCSVVRKQGFQKIEKASPVAPFLAPF